MKRSGWAVAAGWLSVLQLLASLIILAPLCAMARAVGGGVSAVFGAFHRAQNPLWVMCTGSALLLLVALLAAVVVALIKGVAIVGGLGVGLRGLLRGDPAGATFAAVIGALGAFVWGGGAISVATHATTQRDVTDVAVLGSLAALGVATAACALVARSER